MKNSEILAKAKKEGYNNLTLHELRRVANVVWKEETFSLNGLVKYIQSTNDESINAMLKKVGISKEVITVKWLLSNCDPDKLKKRVKDEKTGKWNVGTEKKEKFSLWFVSGTILRFHADIQSKAQSSQPAKVKKPELTEGEQTKKDVQSEVKQSAAKVAANKRRVEETKKSKAKKTTKTAKVA